MQQNLKFWWIILGLTLAAPSFASVLTVEPIATVTSPAAIGSAEAETSELFRDQVAVVRTKSGKACKYPDDCLPSTCVFTPSWRLHQRWDLEAGLSGTYLLRVSVKVEDCGFDDLALSASYFELPTQVVEGNTVTVDSTFGSFACPGQLRENYVSTARQDNIIVGVYTFSIDVADLCSNLAAPCVMTPHHEFIRDVSPGTPGTSDYPTIEMNLYVTASDCASVSLTSISGDGAYETVETEGKTLKLGGSVFTCLTGSPGFGHWVWAYDQYGDDIGWTIVVEDEYVDLYCPTQEEWDQ